MFSDNIMMLPPVATGAVDRDTESVGISSNGAAGRVLSSDGRSQKENKVKGTTGPKDFKKAYLQVSESSSSPHYSLTQIDGSDT